MKQFRHAVTVPVFLAMLLASGCGTSGTSGGLSFTWKNYAHLTNKPMDRPWVVLMCKYSDLSAEPAGLFQKAKEFLTSLGQGTGNMYDYWSDVSYGAISIAGSEVQGWYTAPYSWSGGAQFAKKYGVNARYERVQQCADQVPASDVDFSQFFGVIVVLNKVGGGGACGTSSVVEKGHHLACVLFDPNSFYTAFAAQEMGHGYGLAHSSDETHGQYKDPFDVMSTLGANMFEGCNYTPVGQTCHGNSGGWDGPGLNVPNLLALGWIPPKRVATYFLYAMPPQVVTLAALSHPEASGDLALLVEDQFDPSKLYTVEFRTPDGWDQGFGNAAVYIHEYTPVPLDAVTLYSFLQKKGTHGGQLFAGDSWSGTSWSGPSTSWRVDVLSIGQTTATIQIHSVINGGGLVGDEPVVQIQAPADGSHVTAGTPFQLVARATTSSGTPLPSSAVVWTANGTSIGTGATLTTSLSAAGSPYTITVTGTDPSQHLSASGSITLYVDPPATPVPTPPPGQPSPTPTPPTVVILSPTSGQSYRIPQGGSFQIVLSASASAGVTQYAWSDTLHLFTDSKPNDTVTITQGQLGCQSRMDTINLTATDSQGQTANAPPVTISLYPECTS